MSRSQPVLQEIEESPVRSPSPQTKGYQSPWSLECWSPFEGSYPLAMRGPLIRQVTSTPKHQAPVYPLFPTSPSPELRHQVSMLIYFLFSLMILITEI
jgi:hypothetical protein